MALIWFRTEHKALERRSIATASVVGALSQAGFDVVVEENELAGLDIAALQQAGARTAPAGSWREAPAEALVVGLKELDPALGPFRHDHVHFAHAFKYQDGWEATLAAFREGGGQLYDLEYLVDDDGRRLAAFGYFAGFVGAALAVQAHAAQAEAGAKVLSALEPWSDEAALIDDTRAMMGSATQAARAIVIGARGRSGGGAVAALRQLGIETTCWDIAETAAGGPFPEILEHDLLINCVLLGGDAPAPFLTDALLDKGPRRLRVIADVSCDPGSAANPLPIYREVTSLMHPVARLRESPPLDLIAIDHLPSLLPRTASAQFADELLPFLLDMAERDQGPWARAAAIFRQRLSELADKA